MKGIKISCLVLVVLLSVICVESAPQAYRRDPGHPTWHHGAFQDVKDSVRSDVRQMLHSRAEVPFQVPLEVNVVLIGFNGDGGYRYSIDSQKLEEFLRVAFPSHRPSCLETGQPLDIEHHVVFNAFPAGQPELIALEKAVRLAMDPAGTAREVDFGREVPLFEVEATAVEPEFEKLYSYLFDIENGGFPVEEMDRPRPTAIFVVNFDKLRIDPRNKGVDLDSLMYGKIPHLTEEELKNQEGSYIYRYRYNGGGASQIWLGSGRFVVIDLSAGPCTYGKIETEEGSVNPRTLPRLQSVLFPRPGSGGEQSAHDVFIGKLSAAIATTVEHVIAPDVRYETVDMTTRLLVPIIVLQNHNRYNIMSKGHNYSIAVEAIEVEVKKMLHQGQEVVIVGGTHALHRHEKLAIAVSKAMRGRSLQETKTDGRFHVHTKTYLDGAILKEEMERSADVLAAGLLDVSDPTLSSKYFLRQTWMDDSDGTGDSILKHKPLWASYGSKNQKEKRRSEKKKQGDLFRTYGTRVVPVFVLSLADVDDDLMMEDESLVWTSNDVVIVLQHQNDKIPLSYVSELERRQAVPSQAQRHILAGLASVVGGMSAPFEKASHIHERPIVNWLLAAGCHPFGPFSNTAQISQLLRDVALRNAVYARVDAALHRIRETSEAYLVKYGKQWDGSRAHTIVGKTPYESAATIVEDYELPVTADELLSELSPIFTLRSSSIKAQPGANRLILHLRSHGVLLGLASNCSKADIETKISYHHGWKESFSVILGGDEVISAKPSPEIYLEAAKKLKMDSSRCLVIEDSLIGVDAGKAAGMEVVAVPSLPKQSHLFTSADEVINSLLDFKPEKWGLPAFEDWVEGTLPVGPWYIGGPVIKGYGRGSKVLGIPTANLSTEGYSDLLSEHPSGVYFGWARLATRGVYKMVMSIGWNPYFNNTEKTIEPWLLHDFKEDFYGEDLRLAIVGYIRPEANFSSLESLVAKIHEDGEIAAKALELPLYSKYRDDPHLRNSHQDC